jgi:drug/metabolite transporter (DMT)-like permease
MKKLQTEKLFTKHSNVLLLSLLCTILWGSAYPCIKTGYQLFGLATNDVSGKLVFAGIRFFLAGLITLTIYMLQNKRFIFPERTKLKGIFMVSITQTVLEYLFFYISMSHITGVKGSILNASSSFFVVILAHLFYKNDKITLPKMMGCIIGFGGIIMINLNGMNTFNFHFNFMGDGMMLLSGLSFAVGSLLSKNISQKSDPMMVTGYQLGFGGFLLLLLGLITGGTLKSVSIPGILLLTYMAFLSATAFTIWTILSKYNKISKIAVYNFLTPVFGALLSSIFLGENLLTLNNLLALLLVSIGIGIVNMVKNTSSIRDTKS